MKDHSGLAPTVEPVTGSLPVPSSTEPDWSVESFRNFLEGSEDEIVGVAGSSYWCPLAEWTYHMLPLSGDFQRYQATPSGIYRSGYTKIALHFLDPWMLAFMRKVDTRVERNRPIRGKQALSILEEAVNESSRADE